MNLSNLLSKKDANQRTINEIIIHCSATTVEQNITAYDVDKWHKAKGWSGIGYHFFIRLDGTIEMGRPIYMEGAHCYGHNKHSIGICYAGGVSKQNGTEYFVDTRTNEQKQSLITLIRVLLWCFPSIQRVVGHDYYSNKACPCFDAFKEYIDIVQQNKDHLQNW